MNWDRIILGAKVITVALALKGAQSLVNPWRAIGDLWMSLIVIFGSFLSILLMQRYSYRKKIRKMQMHGYQKKVAVAKDVIANQEEELQIPETQEDADLIEFHNDSGEIGIDFNLDRKGGILAMQKERKEKVFDSAEAWQRLTECRGEAERIKMEVAKDATQARIATIDASMKEMLDLANFAKGRYTNMYKEARAVYMVWKRKRDKYRKLLQELRQAQTSEPGKAVEAKIITYPQTDRKSTTQPHRPANPGY